MVAPVSEYHPGVEMIATPKEPKERHFNQSTLNLS